jgi:aryl-alcohol dehydrogenase-like predicted oxidoreductase
MNPEVHSAKDARAHGVAPAQIACAWMLQAPGVTAPIIGATKAHHLKERIEAVVIKLTKEEVDALERPYRPHPVFGFEAADPRRMLAQ